MVGRMINMRGLTLPGALTLGVLAIGAALTPSALKQSYEQAGPPERASALIKGHYTEVFEDFYSEQLAVRELAVALWGTIDYALFGVGRPGVVAGRDGWLFTEEEYRTPIHAEANLQANLDFAAHAHSVLADQSIGLVIALVPAKATIYPEHLSVGVPSGRAETYAAFMEGLREAQIPFVDPTTVLLAGRKGSQVFMARDTHWTPEGAKLVADKVSGDVSYRISTDPTGYARADLPILMHTGDLTKFTPVGSAREWLGLADEEVRPFDAKASEGEIDASGLFGALEIPVALVGTSYSAQEQWSFAAALRLALDTDVLNLAEDGGGPIKPMAVFLSQLNDLDALPQMVIWEWPLRFADTEYADAQTR